MTEFDQRYQKVVNQHNVVFNDSQRKDTAALIINGVKLIEIGAYKQAISTLKSAAEADASLSEAYYYWALALLEGKRPKVHSRSRIEEMDQLLQTARAMGDKEGTIQWFRILIRSDYYGEHGGMKCLPPSIPEIIASIGNTDVRRLKGLLQKLPMKGNIYYRELVKQLY